MTSDPWTRRADDSRPSNVHLVGDYTSTDDGNALRLVDAVGDRVCYCPERGRWLRWTGTQWHWDVEGVVREHARLIARELPDGDSKEEAAFKRRSLSAPGVSSMVRLAQTDERVVVNIADLDAEAWMLNTPSGIVDLRSGEVRDQAPGDLVTKCTAVGIGKRNAPRWRAFLAETFGRDTDLINYVQRLLGHALIGEVTEHVLPFGYGAGANGKSVLMSVVMGVVGIGDGGYAIQAPSDFLMAKAATVHPTEIARLRGARLVVCQELNAGQRFDEAKVKQLTGGDALAGRFMRQDFFTFTPTHHLWLIGNHQPEVKDGGPAFWRRVRLIPFDHVVPEEDRDQHLAKRLVDAEGPAILRWLVDGAVLAVREGIGEPAAVITATAAYKFGEDTVSAFVGDCCRLGHPNQQGYSVRVAALRDAYETWCRQNGLEPVSAKALAQRLHQDHGVTLVHSSTRSYKGIRLKTEYEMSQR